MQPRQDINDPLAKENISDDRTHSVKGTMEREINVFDEPVSTNALHKTLLTRIPITFPALLPLHGNPPAHADSVARFPDSYFADYL